MKKLTSKIKASIFIVSVIVVSLSIVIGNVLIRNYRITNELTAIAESCGLKDIKISIGGKIPDYDFYEVTVDSSNLESLSYSQMYSLANKMHRRFGSICQKLQCASPSKYYNHWRFN